jgi:hypothetical protein
MITTRRAVFIDVENSSRADYIAAILAHLDLGELGPHVQLVAVGNWRVVGNEAAQMLSRRGAILVHSAPAFGVKDWTDLRIAVAAGTWLGDARPGDRLDIVTDDQAFDAIGDVAAGLGVEFRRLSYRALVRDGVVDRAATPRRRHDGRAKRRPQRLRRRTPPQ